MTVQQGQHGEPLPTEIMVCRLCRVEVFTIDSPPAAEIVHFTLSSGDKKEEIPRLSVWAEPLTSPEQAHDIMLAMNPLRKRMQFAVFLRIADIETLRPDPESPQVPVLQVVWDHIGEPYITMPGADGHSGIEGLDTISGVPRKSFLSLRSQLADLANKHPKYYQRAWHPTTFR